MGIQELAKRLNRKGDQFIAKNGIKDFHKEAFEVLSKSEIHKAFYFQEIVNTAFNPKATQIQNFKNLEFSDLPVTLSRGEHCFIDLYFWRRRPTTIHNHHFTGAFMCLLGNNVDLEFSFEKLQKLGKFHELGNLKVKEERKLGPGDVVSIDLLDRFIHQNHHQADLTVNLCFRTPDIGKKNLSNYLYSGLRYEKDPGLLGRLGRLKKFADIEHFDLKKLVLSDDDLIGFFMQNYGAGSQNPFIKKILKFCQERIGDKYGINLSQIMDTHDLELERLEDQYE